MNDSSVKGIELYLEMHKCISADMLNKIVLLFEGGEMPSISGKHSEVRDRFGEYRSNVCRIYSESEIKSIRDDAERFIKEMNDILEEVNSLHLKNDVNFELTKDQTTTIKNCGADIARLYSKYHDIKEKIESSLNDDRDSFIPLFKRMREKPKEIHKNKLFVRFLREAHAKGFDALDYMVSDGSSTGEIQFYVEKNKIDSYIKSTERKWIDIDPYVPDEKSYNERKREEIRGEVGRNAQKAEEKNGKRVCNAKEIAGLKKLKKASEEKDQKSKIEMVRNRIKRELEEEEESRMNPEIVRAAREFEERLRVKPGPREEELRKALTWGKSKEEKERIEKRLSEIKKKYNR